MKLCVLSFTRKRIVRTRQERLALFSVLAEYAQ